MNHKYRLFVSLAIMLLLFNIIFLVLLNRGKQEVKFLNKKGETKMLSALFVSFRETYQRVFVENHIKVTNETVKLLPVKTTAEIGKIFSDKMGFTANIRTVSDRPRNINNLANETEMKIISYFKKNPTKKTYINDSDSVFYYAEPLYITKNCLSCHGKKEDAPLSIKSNYSKAYNYKLGELRGIISITTTNKAIYKLLDSNYISVVVILSLVYIIFLVISFFLLKFFLKKDKEFTDNLKKQVAKKTKELSATNENLKIKNEEFLSLNEELNQNNEELLTSKEILEEQKNVIEKSKDLFASLIDTFDEGCYISNSENIITYMNEPLKRILGDKTGEFCHKAIYSSDKVCKDCVYNSLLKEEHITYDTYFEDRKKHLSIRNVLLKDKSKLTIFYDISEQKRSEKEITEKNKILEAFTDELYRSNFDLLSSQEKLLNSEAELRKRKEDVEDAHRDIMDNIRYAKKIQESLLTSKTLMNEYLYDYFLIFKPKDQVSGDFYYVKEYDNYLTIAVADCTGHGVTGGFLTMLGITYLHEIINDNYFTNPAKILNILRERVKETFMAFGTENPNGMDISVCIINKKNNELTFAGAFNPLWIVREKKLFEYNATRNPIGFYPIEKDFTNTEIKLQDNDKLYLFSDGYQDQVDIVSGKKLIRKQFKELILNISDKDMLEQKDILVEELEKRIGSGFQIDDITVMGINWKI